MLSNSQPGEIYICGKPRSKNRVWRVNDKTCKAAVSKRSEIFCKICHEMGKNIMTY